MPKHREQDDRQRIPTRQFNLRAATINEQERTVEAAIATGQPVEVYDWRRGEAIDEILLPEGAELPQQMPMLANHSRWSLRDMLGCVRGLRIEDNAIAGRLHFAAAGDDAEHAWQMVRGGHLTDVSVGYRVTESTEIAAGQTATVLGKPYTAGKRLLRVATRWMPKETSLVPIGADAAAKIREDHNHLDSQEIKTVNPKLRTFLETIGLQREATELEAKGFYDALNTEDRQRADAAVNDPQDPPEPPVPPPPPPVMPVRSEDAAAQLAAQQAIEAEHARIRRIRQLASSDIPAEVVNRAIDERWTEAQATSEFLRIVREGRDRRGVAVHSRSHESDCTRDALAAALMVRNGLDPVLDQVRFVDGCYVPRREGQPNGELEQAAERGWQYRDMSLIDFCREALRLDGQRIPSSRSELIRAAVSGSSLSNIFTTSINAQLLQGYQEAADSTVGWCSESDVANFLTNDRAQMGKFGAMSKHGRGGTADHLNTSDLKESYKIARYSGQFVVDEMDIIDDRFGAIEQRTPVEIGYSAASLRPDLVYSIILANAALDADSVALFHSTHANTTTGALAAATLQASIQIMAKQRKSSRPLNLRPRYLIVPQDLVFTAEILLSSAERYTATSDLGSFNPLRGRGIEVRADDRIGATGVTDPSSGTAYTGTATNYYLFARPGEGGAKTIEVGYLRGTGRAPQVRSFALTQGQWGLGWDINMDIGAKALDYPGVLKSTGA
jgi:hypothetical protein